MRNYSGHFLRSSKGANSDFSSAPLTIHPGAVFNNGPEADETILLGGGFPATSAHSSFPLSPTLQLNGDLSDTDTTEMTALARAELIRHNSQSYRSYTLEADARVTVLATDATVLHTFISTYGGVLQITPILSKGYAPEFTTIQGLQIEDVGEGLKLSFTVKHPVDRDRCTSCGACGEACPEQCLDEQLFLDFSRCSFCKECINSCPHEAIDLHGVEGRELTSPALLILEGVEAELPERTKNIYFETELSALFASIYAREVDEIIDWKASICQYSPRLQTGCSACVDSCPHGAVQQTREAIILDHLACLECGACLSSCPTGALQYKRFDDLHFIEYFRTFPLQPGSTVVLGDEGALHKHWWYSPKKRLPNIFFMEQQQPAALHAMHLLFLYCMGAKQILILTEGQASPTAQMQITNRILAELFSQKQPVRMVNSDQLNELHQGAEENNAPHRFYHDFSYSNRREKLMALVQFLLLQSSAEPEHLTGAGAEDFGTILCDEDKCTGCNACIGECRTGSLTTDGKNFSLCHTPALCVQCGICVSVCPENALSTQHGLSLEEIFFKEQVLATTEPARCKSCGKVFGSRKSLEKVMSILSARGMWDKNDDLLSYCENCRIISLYGSVKNG